MTPKPERSGRLAAWKAERTAAKERKVAAKESARQSAEDARAATESATLGHIDAATRRTRRRFARRQWRRRWLQAKPLIALTAVLALIATGIWLVWFSSVLAVSSVVVQGTSVLSVQQVRTAAAVRTGTALASVDLSKIRHRVGALAPVESVVVSRRWPDQILVEVTERTAIAVIDIGGRLRGLDKDGVVFGRYQSVPKGMPKVVTPAGTEADALREAARVVAALPAQLAKITDHVEVATADQISLALTRGRTVQWGSSADSAQKAQVLTALLRRKGAVYDVSVPGQPTTR